jgi:hypothetical protein
MESTKGIQVPFHGMNVFTLFFEREIADACKWFRLVDLMPKLFPDYVYFLFYLRFHVEFIKMEYVWVRFSPRFLSEGVFSVEYFVYGHFNIRRCQL